MLGGVSYFGLVLFATVRLAVGEQPWRGVRRLRDCDCAGGAAAAMDFGEFRCDASEEAFQFTQTNLRLYDVEPNTDDTFSEANAPL